MFLCLKCGKEVPKDAVDEIMSIPLVDRGRVICPCGGECRGVSPAITGTRDGFGIGKNFIDEKTKKEITTWREWEKAGYRKPDIKNPHAKEACEKRMHELSGQRLKQPLPQDLPV